MSKPGEDRASIEPETLEAQVGRGLTWSFINTVIGRLGSFLTGIVIARIVVPEDFGVYAVALVALSLLLSMNELGVSAAIVRHKGPVNEIAPTVSTIAIGSSLVLFAIAWFAAEPFTEAMGVPAATGIVRLMSAAVIIDGIASVPVALLTRSFMQSKRMKIDLIAFAISTPVTIILAVLGQGAWSLAWGAIVGNVVTGVFSLLWAPARFLPGWNKQAVGELLRFGLPLAGASLLLLALLNADFVVVGRTLGTVQLGFYLLAFNLSTWPMSLVSNVVRRITTAAYARLDQRGDGANGFRQSVFIVVSVGALVCVLLAAYAGEIVTFLYGVRWEEAALAVPALVVLSLGRMLVELTYDYLVALGRTIGNAWLHGGWLVVLVPALIVGATLFGIQGVAWAHAVVVLVVVVPGLAVLLHKAGSQIGPLVGDLVLPALGSLAVLLSAWLVQALLPTGFLTLAVGGVVGVALFALIVGPKFVRTYRRFTIAQTAPA
ncbi:MAG TPA: oligosaccharide flippase family protein [Microbacteriaceae bacterium]|jgi:PST family polysaccharide transporter|nr:oligosaccharide flippase family protein [Microbacteriaceae bacterium]